MRKGTRVAMAGVLLSCCWLQSVQGQGESFSLDEFASKAADLKLKIVKAVSQRNQIVAKQLEAEMKDLAGTLTGKSITVQMTYEGNKVKKGRSTKQPGVRTPDTVSMTYSIAVLGKAQGKQVEVFHCRMLPQNETFILNAIAKTAKPGDRYTLDCTVIKSGTGPKGVGATVAVKDFKPIGKP